MNGLMIKNIKLFSKTLIIYIVFAVLPCFLDESMIGTRTFYYVFLFLVSIFSFLYCHFLIKIDYKSNKLHKGISNKLSKNGFICSDLYPIYFIGDKKEYVDVAEMLFGLVNTKQREIFIEKGYVIIIGSFEDLYCFAKRKGALGSFNQAQKIILLYTDFEKDNGVRKDLPMVNFISTFHHEWGHFVDFMNYYISESIPFLIQFNSEKKKFFKFYNAFKRYTTTYLSDSMVNFKSMVYEFTDSSEYFATKYSSYKTGSFVVSYFRKIFDELEGVESANISDEIEV